VHPLAPVTDTPVPTGLVPLKHVELTEVDFRVTGLPLTGHPMKYLRDVLTPNGLRTTTNLRETGRNGERVGCARLVICRQRPGTAKGFVFLTLDETGIIVEPQRLEPDSMLISTSPLLLIRGVLQVVEGVVNLRAHTFRALKAESGEEYAKGRNFH
jgi:error-prone DNA polymerase